LTKTPTHLKKSLIPIQRQILHVDMDTFFVSVERLLDPSLIGKPVIVGADPRGRGVVAAASYEARAYGVHSAMPIAQAYRLCPHAVFLRGHSKHYSTYSHRLRAIFNRYSPLVEMGSLEEAYIDLTGTHRLHGPAPVTAEKIHHQITTELRLPASLGMATNKLLAKVASGCAKPNGLIVLRPGCERAFLTPLPLRKLPGIGKHCAQRLERFGLTTIGDLALLGEEPLHAAFGTTGTLLYERSMGIDDAPVEPTRPAQSVGREHTFQQDTCHLPTVCAMLSYLCEHVGENLRETNVKAKTLTTKLRYSDFKTLTRSVTLTDATWYDTEIFRVAKAILLKTYTRRVRIRLIGISASNLLSDGWQVDFLDMGRAEKLDRLYHSIDRIKTRYGTSALLRAISFSSLNPTPHSS
jgi:DNA polymerase-4